MIRQLNALVTQQPAKEECCSPYRGNFTLSSSLRPSTAAPRMYLPARSLAGGHCRLALEFNVQQRVSQKTCRLRPLSAARSSLTPSQRALCATADGRVTVLVPVADGSEEIETVSIVDTLVRAGAAVTMASVEPQRLHVKCTFSPSPSSLSLLSLSLSLSLAKAKNARSR